MAFGRRRAAAEAAEPKSEPKSLGASLWETVKTIFWALLIAGVFRTLFFQPFFIPSGSMKDTLLVGDFLFVNKWAYGYSYASCPSIPFTGIGADDLCGFLRGDGDDRIWGAAPERGDVIVFRHPVTGADFIKRLVGLPGDTVEVRDGVLFVNGEAAPLVADGTFDDDGAPIPRFLETLPAAPGGAPVTHHVLDMGSTPQDATGVYAVPEGQLFFMGDNRDNSIDSRFPQERGGVGFVPVENLIGRADRVMFSSAGASMLFFWTWRADRFFRAID